jgi:hypothetical protein
MEPIGAIALSLALGAGSIAGKEVVSAVVKDAYAALRSLIKNRYPKVSIEQLEQAPESKNRRAVVEEDLTTSGAGQDAELVAAARKLTELIQQQAPGVARRALLGAGTTAAVAQQWFDRGDVQMIVDHNHSATALAVSGIVEQSHSPGGSDFNSRCQPHGPPF